MAPLGICAGAGPGGELGSQLGQQGGVGAVLLRHPCDAVVLAGQQVRRAVPPAGRGPSRAAPLLRGALAAAPVRLSGDEDALAVAPLPSL